MLFFQATISGRDCSALARSECRHRCGLCDGRLFIPANCQVLRGTLHNGRKSCSARRWVMRVKVNAALLDPSRTCSLALWPALLLFGNLRPRVTTTPLPHATRAYGQFPGRDFNPLDLLLLLRTVESFKLSNDTHFIKKICGHRWLAPQSPEHAMVLCCDEKCRPRHLTIRSLTCTLSADEAERCVCVCSVLTTIINSIIQCVKQILNNTVCKKRHSLLFL
jgi:hypothetical protein